MRLVVTYRINIASIAAPRPPEKVRFGIFHNRPIGRRLRIVIAQKLIGHLCLRDIVARTQATDRLIDSQQCYVGIRLRLDYYVDFCVRLGFCRIDLNVQLK